MDPLSQAVLGASLSQSRVKNNAQIGWAFIIGCLSGMAPDLDVFIRSTEDPLLFLDFHRQFTHSLIFIPIGALICALPLAYFARHKLNFKEVYIFAFLGYATHGLLDTCTSYGTQLFWPFTNMRVAWNNVSIVDPLFTLPILVLILLSFYKKKRYLAQLAFVFALSYLALGGIQQQRAKTTLLSLATERGHQPKRIIIKPSFGNLILWRSIYEYQERYYIDAIKTTTSPYVIKGDSIAKLNLKKDIPWLTQASTQANDIERFRWFSGDYLALDPNKKNKIIDVRYSLVPNEITPLWGIELMPEQQNKHISYIVTRQLNTQRREKFLDMLF